MSCHSRVLLDSCPLHTNCYSSLRQTRRSIASPRFTIGPTSSRSVTRGSKNASDYRQRPENHESIDSSPPSSFLKQKASQVASNRHAGLGPSITPAEQAVFDNIASLFDQSNKSSQNRSNTRSRDQTSTDYEDILRLFASMPRESHQAIEDKEPPSTPLDPRKAPTRSGQSILDDDDQRAAVSSETSPYQFMPFGSPARKDTGSHRQAVREDLSTTPSIPTLTPTLAPTTPATAPNTATTEPTTSSSTTEPDEVSTTAEESSTDDIGQITHKITKDVADSLTTALESTNPRPDMAMWQVAEEKIFPLTQLLRPRQSSSSTSPSPSPSSSGLTASSANSTQDQDQRQIHPMIPPSTPPLPLLTQIYPSLTLLLLRLYTTHHPTSPYAQALLPTLKSLGPTSYVLGANTHFYNTLLSLQWTVYSDLREMNDLLTEMEANGVEFDLGTWHVLKRVVDDREEDLGSGKGERGARWWSGMEPRLWWERVGGEWKEMVKRRLEEKGMSTGEVMREVGSGQRSGIGIML